MAPTAQEMDLPAIGPSVIATATGVALEKATLAHSWLTERGDECLFACSGTKITSGTERLVLVSRYRMLLVRWKYYRAAFVRTRVEL